MLLGTTAKKLKQGITLDEAAILAMKNGLFVQKFRPVISGHEEFIPLNKVLSNVVDNPEEYTIPSHFTSLPTFRTLLRMCTRRSMHVMIINNSRQSLKQTGDGHFSVIAAYDSVNDSALFLDVAKYKYPPYWVKINTLYKSMADKDNVTSMQRGYMVASRRRNDPKAYVCKGFYDIKTMSECKLLLNKHSKRSVVPFINEFLTNDYILQGVMFANYQFLKYHIYNSIQMPSNSILTTNITDAGKRLKEVANPYFEYLMHILQSFLFPNKKVSADMNAPLLILKEIFSI